MNHSYMDSPPRHPRPPRLLTEAFICFSENKQAHGRTPLGIYCKCSAGPSPAAEGNFGKLRKHRGSPVCGGGKGLSGLLFNRCHEEPPCAGGWAGSAPV